MKVLISGRSSWAIWKFRKNFLKYLEKKNIEIFFLLDDDNYLKKIGLIKINFIRKKNFLFLSNILAIIKKNGINVILEYDIRNLFFHKFNKIFFNINYNIILVWAGLGHNYNMKFKYNLIEQFILKSLLKSCSQIVMINKYDLSIVRSYNFHNHFSFIKSEGFKVRIKKKEVNFYYKKKYKFISAFRPIDSKGISEITAVANIYRDHKFYLYLIPKSKEINYNSDNIKISKLKSFKNIIIKKQVEDLYKVLPRYDCLISASYGEGFGLTIAEAVDNLIPVVSTLTNGIRDIFNSKCIIYVKPRDIDSLSSGIKQFLSMNSLEKKTMVNNAKKMLIKEVKNEAIFKKMLGFINEYD